MLSSGIFARSVLALAFIPVTSMTCGTTSWVDGCSELRFGDHSLRIQQLNVRMGGARSHRPWWKEEEQLRDTIDGTGGVVWGSARILCEYLVANPELVNGKRVLELGSGTGMTALLCKALGAAAVTATDVRDQLALINVNLQLNPSLEIRVVPLQWGAQGDIQTVLEKVDQPDILIGTDLVYAGSNTTALLETIGLLSAKATEADHPLIQRMMSRDFLKCGYLHRCLSNMIRRCDEQVVMVVRTDREGPATSEVEDFVAQCTACYGVRQRRMVSAEGRAFVMLTIRHRGGQAVRE